MNIHGWFPLGLTGLIPLLSKGLSRVFSNTTIRNYQFFSAQSSFWPTSYMAQMVKNLPAMQETWFRSLGWEDPLEKGMATHSSILAWRIPWTEEPGRLQSMGSQRVRHYCVTNTFLAKSKHLLIFWLQSLSAVILEPKKRKSVTVYSFPPSICNEVMGLDTMIFIFWMLSIKSAFSVSLHLHEEAL